MHIHFAELMTNGLTEITRHARHPGFQICYKIHITAPEALGWARTLSSWFYFTQKHKAGSEVLPERERGSLTGQVGATLAGESFILADEMWENKLYASGVIYYSADSALLKMSVIV